MKIKLLIATVDDVYAEHLSSQISLHYADLIDVAVCKTISALREMPKGAGFDVALLDEQMLSGIDVGAIRLPLLLRSGNEESTEITANIAKMRKYRRISAIVAELLERYARIQAAENSGDDERARITAIWSPAGGVGKTTIALAFAAKKASEGKQALYLNLEPFSSAEAYFIQTGKSISTVFEMLESREGNINALIRGICKHEPAIGVGYLCRPENFDDINILSVVDVHALIDACACVTEELVVDMSCICDQRACKVFELADRVLIVTDPASTTEIKLKQFQTQHNIYSLISEKTTLVANKGAAADGQTISPVISFPYVRTADAVQVYKTLAHCEF